MTKVSLLALMSFCAAGAAFAAGSTAQPAKKPATTTAAPQTRTTTTGAPAKREGAIMSADRQLSGQGYGMGGCGLGSMLFGEKKGFVQVFAATTNGTFGTQTFGITTGTSNCQTDDRKFASLNNYVSANKEALAKDVARGEGETLAALTQVMGCSGEATQQMGRKLQAQYESVFSSSSELEISSAIRNVVKNDAELSTACSST